MTVSETSPPERRLGPSWARDVAVVAERSIRLIPREPAAVIPALVVPVFFYLVGLGALRNLTEATVDLDFRAFMLPVSCLFAVTGVSRAVQVVRDIQSGYFDRLLMTPISRPALLLGLMAADIALVLALTSALLVLGVVTGVSFETGLVGLVAYLAIIALWSVSFAGFLYAVALRTSSAGAVSACMSLFYPLAFLTSSLAPEETMTGWFKAVAVCNPVTYLLRGLRALVSGTGMEPVGQAFLVLLVVGAVSHVLARRALDDRVRRGAGR